MDMGLLGDGCCNGKGQSRDASTVPFPVCTSNRDSDHLPYYDIRFHNQAAQVASLSMLLIAVAWIYVVLMIAVVEATSSGGTLLGAFFTLLLYAVLPLGILGYLALGPARRRARRAADLASTAGPGLDPDGGSHAAGDPIAPVREEP
ncbi:MAG: hypothetical protein ABIQ60_09705 [Burkholderiaceae bacterium]